MWALTRGLDGGSGGHALVVVVADGGGGEKKDGAVTICDTGDVSTAVARFGNSQAPIGNYYQIITITIKKNSVDSVLVDSVLVIPVAIPESARIP